MNNKFNWYEKKSIRCIGPFTFLDTYDNNMRYDSLLSTDYKTYLNTKRISGAFTIFVHATFVASGSSANAYGIPNSFVSIARWAANSASGYSILRMKQDMHSGCIILSKDNTIRIALPNRNRLPEAVRIVDKFQTVQR